MDEFIRLNEEEKASLEPAENNIKQRTFNVQH